MKTLKKYLALAAMTIVTLTCLTGCGAKKVDVTYGMDVEFSGIDGEGRAEVVFPDASLGFVDELVISGDEKMESLGDLTRLDAIARTVDYEVEPSKGLSNGDKVTVTVTVDSKKLKELGYSAKTTSKTFTVEGLAVPTELDAFEDFNISFSGVSPRATAEFESSRDVDGATIHYACENNGSLRLGDTVTITASVSDREMYALAEETKEFIVEGVDAYIANADDIPDGLWEEMKAKAEDAWANRYGNTYEFWDYYDFTYIGYEFGNVQAGFSNADPNNCYLVYKGTVNDGEEDFNFYYYYKFENLILHTDGTWDVEIPGIGFEPGFNESFQHNVVWVNGFETLEELKDGITQHVPPYDFETDLA